MRPKNKKSVLILLGVLLSLNILAWTAVFGFAGHDFLEVNFFNIGQGDSIFIETPSQNQILIDGGPGSVVLEKLGGAMPFWDRTIDLVVLTHPESDHVSGLIEVLKKYKVENVLWTGVVRDTAEYEEWLKAIGDEGASIYIAKAGQKITLGKAVLDIVFPAEVLNGQKFKDSNDTSIVAKLIYGENSFLLEGDLTKKGEENILEMGIDINSDILKIAHHGSKTSSAQDFLEKVSPEAAVISVGEKNKYGLPATETLEELLKYGINILRTDKSGDIRIISDGKNLQYLNN
jgi:competence protein ComEC